VTGILGGLVSSTAVTLQFARLSRVESSLGTGLAIGVIGACTVLLPRVLLVSALLNYAVAAALLPLLLPPFAIGTTVTLAALWRQGTAPEAEPTGDGESPLRLWSAIRMTVAFQIALTAVDFIRETLGSPGVLASAALLGLTDVDALTLSMNRLGSGPDAVALAARAITVGIVANSLMKLGLASVLGAGSFRRRAAAGLITLTIATLLPLTLYWG
jgi:uncharacterized membrane protein (DUF4010 family)